MINIPSNIAVSESGFLFTPSTGETFTLNETGYEIFKLLQQRLSEKEIIEKVTELFDAEYFEIEKDLFDFIQQLKKLNIVKEI